MRPCEVATNLGPDFLKQLWEDWNAGSEEAEKVIDILIEDMLD